MKKKEKNSTLKQVLFYKFTKVLASVMNQFWTGEKMH